MMIQRLSPWQAGAYRALMLEAYAAHPEAFTSSVAERETLPLTWWEARLSPKPGANKLVLGAFDGGALAGVLGLSFEKREKVRHKATLFGMYVRLHCRGQGIGRQLVQSALTHARERPGVTVVQLTVTGSNAPAVALYEGCGFLRFGAEPFAVAVGSEYVTKLHMWRRIDPDEQSSTPLGLLR